MASTKPKTDTADTTPPAALTSAAPVATLRPRLGHTINVMAVPGRTLLNNETGTPFAEGVPTSQVVTPNTLSRLFNGDLVRV